MKYTNIILFLALIATSSCGKVKCSDPELRFHITKVDSNTNKLAYELKRYKKGSGFSELLESKKDSILYNNYIHIKTDDDYILSFPSRGLEYKISNIIREELKGVRQPFQMGGGSCSVTKCYNSLSYTMNGTNKNYESAKGCYDLYIVSETEI